MKLFRKNIDAIPTLEEILKLTQQEILVLEFPKAIMNPEVSAQVISELKEKLPENYSVFNSGIWETTVTITITPVLSNAVIQENIQHIKQGIKDYIVISYQLLNNELKDWKLTDEHGIHHRYENPKTGQIVETCEFRMHMLDNIDPYFWGLFIKTSTKYKELNKIVKKEFHDCCKILDFIEKNADLKQEIERYFSE